MIAESQWLFTESELLQTPSILDGLTPEKERESRSKGVNFILQVGIMLKLPQITLATASVFLHRFYMRHSLKGFHQYEIGSSSLFLATKVEENCRKMKELVIACVRVAQKDPHKMVDEQDREYWRWRDVILYNEDVMLEALCFDLSLDPPYKTLFEHLKYFGEQDNDCLRNAAWAFLNDSYLTMLCLMFPSRAIATGALYAAAKHCAVAFPDDERGRPWWDVIDMDLGEIRGVCKYMADIYDGVPSKPGKGGGIYEHVRHNEDGEHDKTRAERASMDVDGSSATIGANGGSASPEENEEVQAGHERRTRDHEEEVEQNPTGNGATHVGTEDNHDGELNPAKRQKRDSSETCTNGVRGQGEGSTDLHSARDDELPLDEDVSEEGEVEA